MTDPIARLEAAKDALDLAKAEYAAAAEAVMLMADETHATQFRTDRLTVSVCTRHALDDTAFLAWTRTHCPHQLTETVQPAFKRAFLDGLRWADGEAVTADGELVEFASETEYLSVRSR